MTCRQWQGVCAFRKGGVWARLVLVVGPKRMMGLSLGFKGVCVCVCVLIGHCGEARGVFLNE